MHSIISALIAIFVLIFTNPAQANIFREPDNVCNIMERQGFALAEPWEKNEWHDYACATEYYALSKTNAVPTNISYYAESESDDEVTYMYLVLNINDDGMREKGKEKYLTSVEHLFKGLEITIPDDLIKTIEEENPKTFDEDYGVVTFEVMRGATDTLRLTIRNRRG